MAKGRMLNRKIATDAEFNSLASLDQWLFMRMLPFMDDFGRITGNLFELKYQTIPSCSWGTQRLRNSLDRIAEKGLITWQEDEVIQFRGFWKNQKIGHKPAESLYPDISEVTGIGQQRSAKVDKGRPNIIKYNIIKSKLNRSNESVNNNNHFEQFWNNYPRKVGKRKAFEVWGKLSPDGDLMEKILGAIEKYKSSESWCDPKYIPHPSTWLNQERWEDEILASQKKPEFETQGKFLRGYCSKCGSVDHYSKDEIYSDSRCCHVTIMAKKLEETE
jgi:hypothetical protein|tara:strand:+ start:1420 stop:2241 length:822 start_codon:yes stop_codon:yes gene_type:complete